MNPEDPFRLIFYSQSVRVRNQMYLGPLALREFGLHHNHNRQTQNCSKILQNNEPACRLIQMMDNKNTRRVHFLLKIQMPDPTFSANRELNVQLEP